jgi:hypothetical protein
MQFVNTILIVVTIIVEIINHFLLHIVYVLSEVSIRDAGNGELHIVLSVFVVCVNIEK